MKGDLAAFTTAVDEQMSGSGPADGKSMTQMNKSSYKAVHAAARKPIGLKAVGMTGEYWKTQDIVKADSERDKLSGKVRIHWEEYKAKDLEAKNLTSEGKDEIWERKVTTAKAKKEMWSIMRSLTTNRSVTTAQIIADNGKKEMWSIMRSLTTNRSVTTAQIIADNGKKSCQSEAKKQTAS